MGIFPIAIAALALSIPKPAMAKSDVGPTAGRIDILRPDHTVLNIMPLERTEVAADIAGFGARVTVRQTFVNPSRTAIEAVYTFPLPNDAAVDAMSMRIGNRKITGLIKRKAEARQMYEQARNNGQVASLLDQERPNIFTQSVANIMPGTKIVVEISYMQLLKYDGGEFEFSYPMVVGPRFLGNAKDPDKISPPVAPAGTRSGQTIGVKVNIDAGAPIQAINSVLHQVKTSQRGSEASVELAQRNEIPNKDFILRYRVATGSVQSSVVSHFDAKKGGFFSLIMMPPQRPTAEQIRPREIIFVMDQSGSQEGFPIEKSKELTLKMIKTLRAGDTFNVIGFNNSVRTLFDRPRPKSETSVSQAEDFVKAMQANGGTQLREGVVAALQGQNDPRRLRIVLFNTDGYVGDEDQIIQSIRKHRNQSRMFSFGIGNSVNRYLLDAMAEEGRGAVEYVTLAESADRAVARYMKRTKSPVLTDIMVDVDGVEVSGLTPRALPDVFDDTPVVLVGRYTTPGHGKITIRGLVGANPWSQTMDLDLTNQAQNPAIPTLWARREVERLSRYSPDREEGGESTNKQIEKLGLDYGIMTAFTSFVAVEDKVVRDKSGQLTTVRVPVEQADGVRYQSSDREADKFQVTGGVALKSAAGFSGTGGLYRGGAGGAPGLIAGSPSNFATMGLSAGKAKSEIAGKTVAPPKIATSLLGRTGLLDIKILFSSLTESQLSKLKSLGFRAAVVNRSNKSISGTINAKKIKELGKLDFIVRVVEASP